MPGTGDPAGVAEPGDPDASAEAQSSDDLGLLWKLRGLPFADG